MCVIIYKPKTETIPTEELSSAWNTNPDGAGYAYIEDGAVHFQRGFMNKKHFLDVVEDLQDVELVLHFRISTSAGVTPQGTHPYKVGNLTSMKAETQAPVVCMNGIIYGQALHKKQGAKLNDTASYVLDHEDAFRVVNQDVLNLIADNTGAKWAAVTPDGVIISDGFQKVNGVYYSNRNHDHTRSIYCLGDYLLDYSQTEYVEDDLDGIIPDDVLDFLTIQERWKLEDYISDHCTQGHCRQCKGCLYDIRTGNEALTFLHNNTRRY